MTEKYSS